MKYRIEVSQRAKSTYFVYIDASSKEEAEQIIWAEDDTLTIWNIEERETAE